MKDGIYNCSNKTLNNVYLVLYYNKVYVPISLRIPVLDWYHFHINQPGGDRLSNTIKQV